mmetsp:Transcript_74528/g.125638  ORF Transcript_74528/g.125638 Transcript_74528/m.125638 type:complete len:556 (+) Transcript_74528:403-2070(+)
MINTSNATRPNSTVRSHNPQKLHPILPGYPPHALQKWGNTRRGEQRAERRVGMPNAFDKLLRLFAFHLQGAAFRQTVTDQCNVLLQLVDIIWHLQGLGQTATLPGVLGQTGPQQMGHGGVRALLPALGLAVHHHRGQVVLQHLEILFLQLEPIPDQEQHQIGGTGQTVGRGLQLPLVALHLLGHHDQMAVGVLEQQVQVRQGAGVAVLEPHQQPLLDGSELVGSLTEHLLPLSQVLPGLEMRVDAVEVLLERQVLGVADAEGLLVVLHGRPLPVGVEDLEPPGQLAGEEPQSLEDATLNAVSPRVLADQNRDIAAVGVVVLEGQHVACIGQLPLPCNDVVKQLLHLGGHSVGVQRDLELGVLHRRNCTSCESQRQQERGLGGQGLAAGVGVRHDARGAEGGGQQAHGVPGGGRVRQVDREVHHQRRVGPAAAGTVKRQDQNGLLVQLEGAGDAHRQNRVLDVLFSRVAQEEIDGHAPLVLAGGAVESAVARAVQDVGHLRLQLHAVLRLGFTRIHCLPDQRLQAAMLLIHVLVVQLFAFEVLHWSGGRVRSQVIH